MCMFTDKVVKLENNVRKYIQDKLRDENRECHLLPFIHG